MAKTNPEKILLRKRGELITDIAISSEAINPGHAVEIASTGLVEKQDTADQDAILLIALENELEGKGITDAWASGSSVTFATPLPGEIYYVRLAAAAAAVVKGDYLELAGDGTFNKLAAGTPKAVALEAVDNSAGGTEVFIQVKIK